MAAGKARSGSKKQKTHKGRKRKKLSAAKVRRTIKYLSLCLSVAAALIIGLLEYTGRIDILVKLGLRDAPAEGEELSVHFIDVGQGDCTLMLSDGKSMLIDSGESHYSKDVIKYIKRKGVKTLDVIVITHPHTDHMGGMADILNSVGAKRIIMPRVDAQYTPTTYNYEEFLKAVQKKGLKIDTAKDESFTLGKADIKIITADYHGENLNNNSVQVKAVNGDNSFLITGDCEREEDELLIEKGADLKAKVLKVAHHGSATGSSADILDRILPRYAVISVGEGNSYGQPHDATMRRLEKYADKIYRTDEDGTVVFISDGKGLSVMTGKG